MRQREQPLGNDGLRRVEDGFSQMAFGFGQRAGLQRRHPGEREAGHVFRRASEDLLDRFLRFCKLALIDQNQRFRVERARIFWPHLFHCRHFSGGFIERPIAQKMRNEREARAELVGRCRDGCAIGVRRRLALPLDGKQLGLEEQRLEVSGLRDERALDK